MGTLLSGAARGQVCLGCPSSSSPLSSSLPLVFPLLLCPFSILSIPSFVYLTICSHIFPFIQGLFIGSFKDLVVLRLIHSFVPSFSHLFVHSFVHSFTHSVFDLLTWVCSFTTHSSVRSSSRCESSTRFVSSGCWGLGTELWTAVDPTRVLECRSSGSS